MSQRSSDIPQWARMAPMVAALCGAAVVHGGDLAVPGDFGTIQAAIEAAQPEDTITVAPGTYAERIDLLGKRLTLRSSGSATGTIIDGGGTPGSTVTCISGEGLGTTIDGFTIRGGTGTPGVDGAATVGGGILILQGGPRIVDCRIVGNTADFGAGMYVRDASPFVDGCTFGDPEGGALNEAFCSGGAVYAISSNPAFLGSEFRGNQAGLHGGGVAVVSDSGGAFLSCTFAANVAGGDGGGLFVDGQSHPLLESSWLQDNIAVRGGAMCSLGESTPVDADGNIYSGNCADFGGAIYADQSIAAFSGATIISNFATLAGGGVFVTGETLTIENTVLSANRTNGSGGAIAAIATAVTLSDAVVLSSRAEASGGHGGAVYLIGGMLDGSGTDFSGNRTSGSGGAIYAANSIVTLDACEFAAGRADLGGAIFNLGTLVAEGCGFEGNLASSLGGAILNESAVATVTNGRFSLNSAAAGGAITNRSSSPEIINCTFTQNFADDEAPMSGGGGIRNLVASAPWIVNATFADNGAGAIVTSGSIIGPRIDNSIIWNNGPDPVRDDQDATALHYTNIEFGWTGPGANNFSADPVFSAPGMGDYRLAAGSPCIDAGDNLAVPRTVEMEVDQNPRFHDDLGTPDTGNPDGLNPPVDVGAYEFQGTSAAPCPGDLGADDRVDFDDLIVLLGLWGPCPDPCPADLAGPDGVIDFDDLVTLLGYWGPCS